MIRARFAETYYTIEDDGSGGSMTVETREPDITPMEFDSWAAVAEFLRDHGLTEDNGHWFSDPDVSHMDYRSGEHTETTLAIDSPRPEGWEL